MPTFALKGICLSMLLFQSLTDRTDWLEEVELIISAKERAAYSELQNDEERAAFVKDFWRRRDPDPSTERNEAREEHCRHLEYVEKRFRQAGLRGAETDRGRDYVIHGEPDQRLPFARGTLRLPWSTQSEKGIGRRGRSSFLESGRLAFQAPIFQGLLSSLICGKPKRSWTDRLLQEQEEGNGLDPA